MSYRPFLWLQGLPAISTHTRNPSLPRAQTARRVAWVQHRPSWCTPWWAGRQSRGPWGTAGHAGRRPGWCSGSWSMGAPGNTGRHRKVLSCVNLALHSQNALACGCLCVCVCVCVCVCACVCTYNSLYREDFALYKYVNFYLLLFKKITQQLFPSTADIPFKFTHGPCPAILPSCLRLRQESDYWVQSEQVWAWVSTQLSYAEKFALIVTGLRVRV